MPGFPVHQYLPGFAVTISIFSHLFAVRDGTGCHDLIFLKIELKPSFTLYSFNFMKRNFINYLAATVKMRGPKVMLENNFQKAKKMISYIHKINMW